jgi:DNA-binding CsgD family transcriptional regulator
MTKQDKIVEWLLGYQDDLVKIIGKHRYPNHKMSVDEILSEINTYVVSKPEKLIEHGVKDKPSFKKSCYNFARNIIKWTAKGKSAKDQKYSEKKVDYVIEDEDGSKTAFEYICSTIGEEDPNFAKLDASQKHLNIVKWILDYSWFLNARQKNILPYVLEGKTLDEIAKPLGITHQAVSHLMCDAFEKIKNYVKVELYSDDDATIIHNGRDSINYLFGSSRKKYRSQFNTSLKKLNH